MNCINPAYITYDPNNDKLLYRPYNIHSDLKNSKVVSCGKCINCLKNKVSGLAFKVQKEMEKEQFKHCYLFTITFNDNNQLYLINKSKLDLLLKDNNDVSKYSPYTTLSKNKINNVIRNLKKKLNNYYHKNVSFSYLLSGEYGSRTGRAHYHILLMLSDPIPDLKLDKITAKDHLKHYKAKLLNSKQYDLYDLVQVNNYRTTAGYVCKYLMKQQELKDKDKYHKFSTKSEKLIFDKIINNIGSDVKDIKKQAPFIKKSQKLGIFNTLQENIDNDTLTPYYLNKYWKSFVFKNKKDKDIPISELEFFTTLKKTFVFNDIHNFNLWVNVFANKNRMRKFKNNSYYSRFRELFYDFIYFIDFNAQYFRDKNEKYLEKLEKYKKYLDELKNTKPKLKDIQYNYISKDYF